MNGASLTTDRSAKTVPNSGILARRVAETWLAQFERLLRGETIEKELFLDDVFWKDALSFTWDIRSFRGRDEVYRQLVDRSSSFGATAFRVADVPAPQIKVRAGEEVVEVFFNFKTRYGLGRGIVRLGCHREPSPSFGDTSAADFEKAWTLLTTLQALDGAEEAIGQRRPRGGEYTHSFGGATWQDRWKERQTYKDRDPEVLIVGGGQAGMALAARLGQMGVDALIVDRQQRVGDNWRKRYKALTLHNETWVLHLPYMPFPESWPVYLPKDMVAGWFETYAWAMRLNVWTDTEFLGATFDPKTKRWTARLRTDAGEKTLAPTHLVIATGMSGAPRIPQLTGIDRFRGVIQHTHSYDEGAAWKDRRALIVGTGNSAHDVAQDLHAHGATVTMVQRSPTTVASVEPAAQLVFALYCEFPAVEDCDLLAVAAVYDVMVKSQRLLTQQMLKLDKKLLEGLEAVGFRTDIGDDDTGYYMKYLRTGGGYYLNVGCSELIAAGKIKILQNRDIDTYVEDGVHLKDGSRIPADLIVLATGYENLQETARRFLGDAIGGKVGPVWGFDENGDMRNVWRQTAQENLWFMAGSFAQSRTYSRYVALQIKAIQQKLIAYRLP